MPEKQLPSDKESKPISVEASTEKAYNDFAREYLAAWDRNKSSVSEKGTSNFDKFIELLPNGRILEIGSGGGDVARWFVGGGYDYLGTDFSSGMLEEARKNNPGISFEQISVYDLDFDEPFDGFWCSATLLHIPKNRLDEALAAIHRNMKPGAYGFISIKEGDSEVMEKDGRFHAYWSDEDFSKHLNDNGYKIIEGNSRLVDHSTEEINWLTYIVQKDSHQDS